MAPLSDYVTGTITLTNGSAAFTGSGTGWLAAAFREGDTILGIEGNPGVTYVIESITDNDAGTLTQPWDGPTGTYEYRMRYLSDGQRVTAQARQLIELLGNGNLQALAGLSGTPQTLPMFTGAGAMVEVPRTDLVSGANYDVQVDTLPDRDAYDGQDAGFAVLVADTGDGRAAIYSKLSNAVGDWSDPAYVTGPSITLDVGSVTAAPFGSDPDVTLTSVPGGYELDFDLPENATFQSGTITTLDPGEDATFSLSPVAGGYAPTLGVPRGPTGDIDGVTPFWQGRITVDATAEAAREGLGALGVGDFGVGGFGATLPESSANNIEGSGLYATVAGDGDIPGDFSTSSGLIAIAGNTTRQIQVLIDRISGKVAARSKNNDVWGGWRRFWDEVSLPIVTQAEAEGGTVTDPRAWPPNRIAQAIAALADVAETGSNANGSYIRFTNGVQWCWGVKTATWVDPGGALRATVTFAATFVSPPSVSYTGDAAQISSAVSRAMGQNRNLTATGVYLEVGRGAAGDFNSGDTCDISFQAIGWWN